jgi:hypothetical protein
MRRCIHILLIITGVLANATITWAGTEEERPQALLSNSFFTRAAAWSAPQTSGTRRRSARRRRRASNKPATSEAQTNTQQSSSSATQGPLSQVTYELPLRKPGAGQERVQGLLTDVACDARGVTFKITAGDKALRLWSPGLNNIHFATYTPDVSGEIVCGVRRPANMVIVVFRPAKSPGAKNDGTPVSVEFVPRNFELKK